MKEKSSKGKLKKLVERSVGKDKRAGESEWHDGTKGKQKRCLLPTLGNAMTDYYSRMKSSRLLWA